MLNPQTIKEIKDLLKIVFTKTKTFAKGTGHRAAYGLVQHGAGTVAKGVVQRLRITTPSGKVLSYEHLHAEDRKVVDELVQFATRFCFQYADHHDEHSKYRMEHHEIEQIIEDHANEIAEAASEAVGQRIRSHAYDYSVGRPASNPVFNDAVIAKQLALAAIMEAWTELSNRQERTRPE